MTNKQIWGGAFMILGGIAALLGNTVGYGNIWPVYPLVIGLLLICLRRQDDSPRRRLARRFGGAWILLTFQYLRHRDREVR